jgi:hypothetical protein
VTLSHWLVWPGGSALLRRRGSRVFDSFPGRFILPRICQGRVELVCQFQDGRTILSALYETPGSVGGTCLSGHTVGHLVRSVAGSV